MNADQKGGDPKKIKAGARYDTELQMFCDTSHEPNREALRFMRWMAEQGRLEHDVFGPASGEYAGETDQEVVDQMMRPAFRSPINSVNLGGRALDGVAADPVASSKGAQRVRVPVGVKTGR